MIIKVDSLVVYKQHPARVRQTGERLEIEVEGGEHIKVRPKDITMLHPGPLHSLGDLVYPAGDVETAWEILRSDNQRHSLQELAELAYGSFTPVTGWAAWRQIEDGLFFTGTPEDVRTRSAEEVAGEREIRKQRAQQAQAWADFLERARKGNISIEQDRIYIREIEDLAFGRRTDSRVFRELGHAERAEAAHSWLLEHGFWNETIDPYPSRLGVPISVIDEPVIDLPDEPRRDLTHLPAFAIDDQGNQDPDDALSLENEQLWVHIADVAALAQPNSPVDQAARRRGANLYLPEGTVGMLPPLAVDRLGLGLQEVSPALSFALELDETGELIDFEIIPSWVCVGRLSYDQTETQIGEEPFRSMLQIAQRYRRRRLANGAVEIDLPETILRVIDGQVVIRPVLNLSSREMVKEAMLMAGEAAARYALARRLAFPFTTQSPPDPAALEEILSHLGGTRLSTSPDLALAFALRRAQMRSQVSSKPGLHAGLGLPFYSRATSPLRRYSDLLAHQQLRAGLRGEAGLDEADLLEHLGEAEINSSAVYQTESQARRHWTLVYLLQHPGWTGEGVLVERRGGRGKAIIPELALDANVHLKQDIQLNSHLRLIFKGANLAELEAAFQVD